MLNSCRYLIAILLVFLVFACSKDLRDKVFENSSQNISIEDVKRHFSNVQEKNTSVEKSVRSSKRNKKFIRKALWEHAHAYTSISGHEVVAVPIFFDNDLNKPGKYAYRKLIYYKNIKSNQLEGFVAEYFPDGEYFQNNLGNISDLNFTGQIIYYDDQGNYINGISAVNGMVSSRVVVGLDGQIMEPVVNKGGKLPVYDNCDVTRAYANCLIPEGNPTHLSHGAYSYAYTFSGSSDNSAEILANILSACGSVNLTLQCSAGGGSDSNGGSTNGGYIYNYTPMGGGSYTPMGPTGGGSGSNNGPGTPGYIGPVLSDEQWMAIEFAGSDDRFTADEKNYLLYNLWVAFALNENPSIKECLFKNSTFQNKAELISCLGAVMQGVSGSGLTPQEQAIMVNQMNSFQIAIYVYNLVNVYTFIETKDWQGSYNYNRGGAGDSDHPNAIKHAMLACMNKAHLGPSLARSLANAHENNQTLSTVNQNPTNYEGKNILMDLHNNEIGLTQTLPHFPSYGNYASTFLFNVFFPKAQNGELYVWIVKGQERTTVAKRTFNQ